MCMLLFATLYHNVIHSYKHLAIEIVSAIVYYQGGENTYARENLWEKDVMQTLVSCYEDKSKRKKKSGDRWPHTSDLRLYSLILLDHERFHRINGRQEVRNQAPMFPSISACE